MYASIFFHHHQQIQRGKSNIIPFDDDKVQPIQALDDEEENNMLFMLNKTILFKDGKGIAHKVTYLGPDSSDGILKHKIRTHNDTEFLIDGILLSHLDAPYISTVPIFAEQYAVDLPKLTHQLLVALLSSRAINNRQRLFYSVNDLHQPTGEKRQGPYPPNPLSNLLGLLHVGTRGTRK